MVRHAAVCFMRTRPIPSLFCIGPQVRSDNEVLFHRVAALTRESADLRLAMIREWARCGAAEQRGAIDLADRQAVLNGVEAQLAASRTRLAAVTAENARLEELGAALRTGLLRLRDVLKVRLPIFEGLLLRVCVCEICGLQGRSSVS